MTRRRNLITPLLGAALAAAIGLPWTPPASAAEVGGAPSAPHVLAGPQVRVEVGPLESESLDGGPCYRERISARQPGGFTIVRGGATARALTVAWEMDIVWTDVIRVEQGEAVFAAGSSETFVPRVEPGDPTLVGAGWSIRLLDGRDYDVQAGGESAAFSGLAGARPPLPEETGCGYSEDQVVDVTLEVGEEMAVLVSHASRRYRLVDGSFPPGIGIDGEAYVTGASTQAGRWTAVVETCPGVAPDQATCGRTTYRFSIGKETIQDDRDPRGSGGSTPTSSTTSTTTGDEVAAVEDASTTTTAAATVEGDGGSGGGLGAGVAVVGGLSVVSVIAIGLAIARRRSRGGGPDVPGVVAEDAPSAPPLPEVPDALD